MKCLPWGKLIPHRHRKETMPISSEGEHRSTQGAIAADPKPLAIYFDIAHQDRWFVALGTG